MSVSQGKVWGRGQEQTIYKITSLKTFEHPAHDVWGFYSSRKEIQKGLPTSPKQRVSRFKNAALSCQAFCSGILSMAMAVKWTETSRLYKRRKGPSELQKRAPPGISPNSFSLAYPSHSSRHSPQGIKVNPAVLLQVSWNPTY